ncbi:thiamine permease [Komagataeibacter xylinus]|nr:permease, cytosine/purine, uracil, thiamine, allantoin family [Komagataeibacter xylinus E25]RFP01785.1 thiamine permease [Komagataeibacter xylinus]RFP05884.1 thiamine permease [Komagataeibacter xylinus]
MDLDTPLRNSVLAVEEDTIFPIPADRRRGNTRGLCLVWLGANQNILAILTGMIYCQVCHLSLFWAALAILAGNAVGGMFMALHAAQGPHLGIPQMQQTRGQFGAYGALLVIVVVIVMYVGFTATLLAIGREQVQQALGGPPLQSPVYALAVTILALCIVGHGWIERFVVGFTYVAATAFFSLAFFYLFYLHALPVQPLLAFPSMHDFVAAISIGVLWQVAYAPYVSDYSRYLPADTPERDAFWSCMTGSIVGTAVPTFLGAYLGSTAWAGNFYAAIQAHYALAAYLLLGIVLVSITVSCTMQIYCAALSCMTLFYTMWPTWRPTARSRGLLSGGLLLLSVLLTILLSGDILHILNSFIEFLLAVLSPWTAINLVDYYLIRHGDYDIRSFFHHDGGIYGRFNRPAIFCYIMGIVVQVPFISNELYSGLLARQMDGVDLSWVVGILLPGLVYWLVSRKPGASMRPVVR